MTTQTRYFSSS